MCEFAKWCAFANFVWDLVVINNKSCLHEERSVTIRVFVEKFEQDLVKENLVIIFSF